MTSHSAGTAKRWRGTDRSGSVPRSVTGRARLPDSRVSLHARRRSRDVPVCRTGSLRSDVLAAGPRKRVIPEIAATPEVVAEDPLSGFCGAAVVCSSTVVTLEDRAGGAGTSR